MFGSSGFGGFGQQQQQQPQQQQQQPTTGLFGQTSTGFGSGAFGQSSSTPAFGQQAQQPAPNTGFGGFGQTQQNAAPAFGAATSTPAFGQPATGGGLFGSSNTASNTGTSGFSFGAGSNTGTSLFGQSSANTGAGTTGGIFGAAKPPTTFGGFGSTTTQQQPATGGGLFGGAANTMSTFGAQPQQGQGTGTAIAPYQISTILEPPKEEGKPDPPNQTPHAFQSITCMPQYAAYSFEELRWQDYQANRKAPTAPPAFGGFGATNTTSAFGGASSTPSTGLFGSTAPTFGAGASTATPAFGAPQQQQQSTGLFGSTNTGSTFGQPAQQQTGGLFGATTSQPAATGGLFGSAPKPATSTFGGFGQTQTSAAPSTGFSFGAPAASTAPATGGLFGSTASSTPASGGLFGQAAQSQPAATGGLFGQAATSQPASTPSFSFGATSSAPKPLFGAAPTSAPAFGATPSATAPKPTFSFGSTPSTGTSLFGQPSQGAQPAQSQPAPTFGQQPATGTSLFGSTGSTFGQQPATSAAPSFGGGLFGAKPAAPATGGLFGSSSTTTPSLFGSQPAQQQSQPQQQQAPSLFGNSTTSTFGGALSTATQPQQPTAYATADDVNAYGSNPLFQSTKPAVARPTDEKKKPPIFSSFRSTPVSKSATKITRLRGFGSPASFNGSASPAPLSSSVNSAATASPGRNSPLKLVSGAGDDAALSPNAFVNRSSVKKLVIDRKAISQSPFSKGRAGSVTTSNGDGGDSRLKVTFDPDAESGLRGSPFASATNVGALSDEGDASLLSTGTPVKRNNDASGDSLNGSATKETPDRKDKARSGKHGTYYSMPSIEALRKMPANSLRSVKDLVVGRVGYGQVAFLQPVDLTTLHSVEDLLGGIVVFEDRNCTVYPDEMETKPRPGQGLNVPATITLERCWPLDKSSRKPIKEGPKLEKHIKRLQSLENTHWVDFDAETGEWVFTVDEF
ncbi:hypothetical protein ACM66B_003784 [Microbotryomycetes sp. NB124-2]